MSTPDKITLLLAEDHAIVRRGLCVLLKAHHGMEVVGLARTGREAVMLAGTLRPDIILMDIAMPQLNGLEATTRILAATPAAKVIILSAHNEEAYVNRMLAAGVAGFIEKHLASEFLIKAIIEVAQGRRYYSPTIARRLRDTPYQQLSQHCQPPSRQA